MLEYQDLLPIITYGAFGLTVLEAEHRLYFLGLALNKSLVP